ncbi:MAG TPA: cell division protein ZipA C-terminal FtsZ-binding domain-containing protein [Gammaproteobacteria bacterium]
MAELRWVLLALGVMLIAGIYLWGRGVFRRSGAERLRGRRRSEPRIAGEDEPVSDEVLFGTPDGSVLIGDPADGEPDVAESGAPDEAPPQPQEQAPPRIEKIVALRFVPRDAAMLAAEAVRALRDEGLEHGRYGIFHAYDENAPGEPRFSVASLTEPGSFDLERLDEPLAGMSFFMVLPGEGDPVDRFDAMVETARSLAHRLDAELFDDRGSTWSIQRERYIREELISYRLQSASS